MDGVWLYKSGKDTKTVKERVVYQLRNKTYFSYTVLIKGLPVILYQTLDSPAPKSRFVLRLTPPELMNWSKDEV